MEKEIAELAGLLGAFITHDKSKRQEAKAIISELGDSESIETVYEAMTHESGHVRLMALDSLLASLKRGENINTDILLEALNDKYRAVRITAASELSNLNIQMAVRPLIRMMENDEEADCRNTAAWCLGKLDNPEALIPLSKALQMDDDRLSQHAASGLGCMSDPRAIEILIRHLDEDKNTLRSGYSYVVSILAKTKKPAALHALLRALQDTNPQKRASVAGELHEFCDLRLAEPLISALDDPHYDVRSNAARSLGRLAWLEHESSNKSEAYMSFVKICREPLIKLLENENSEVRADGVWALAQIGCPNVVEVMIKALQDRDLSIRSEALSKLVELKADEAFEPLIILLKEENNSTACGAISQLEKLGNIRAIEPLARLLENKDGEVRGDAAKALWNLGDRRAVLHLIKAIEDECFFYNNYARAGIASTLGDTGDARAIDPLIRVMNEGDEEITPRAAIALGKLGATKAIKDLTALLSDEVEEIRNAANEALELLRHNVDSKKS